MSWKNLCTAIVSASTLTACANLPAPSAVPIPPNLRAPCERPTMPQDGSAAAVLRWAVQTATALRECADRHAALVEAISPAPQERGAGL